MTISYTHTPILTPILICMHTRAITKNQVIVQTTMPTLMDTNTTKRGDQAPLMRNCVLVI